MADAEQIAIAALGWLAHEPDLFARFLALSGLTADGLRAASGEPGFLAGVLSFIVQHEPTLLAFSDARGLRPEEVALAHRTLAGPADGEMA